LLLAARAVLPVPVEEAAVRAVLRAPALAVERRAPVLEVARQVALPAGVAVRSA
jgi:hypothetical protein